MSSDQYDVDDIVYDGCRALETISEDVKRRDIVAKAGAIPAIVNAMKSRRLANIRNGQADDSDESNLYHAYVQDSAAGALAELAKFVSNRKIIQNTGGVEALVTAMNMYRFDEDLQKTCCYALGELARTMVFRQLIVDSGAIRSVFAALRKHKASSSVQQAGLWILALIADTPNEIIDDNDTVLMTRNMVSDLGALRIAVQAMNDHTSDAYVQSNGAWLLSKLARCTERRKQMESAIQPLLNSLDTNAADAAVHNCVCFALAELAKYPPFEKVIVDLKGISLITGAIVKSAPVELHKTFDGEGLPKNLSARAVALTSAILISVSDMRVRIDDA